MTISAEKQTIDALLASIYLTALVDTRIYPDEIPEGRDPPCVIYSRGNTTPNYTLDDTLVASAVTMNVIALARSRSEANTVALAITNAMHAEGHMQTEQDSDFEPDPDMYAAIQSFAVWEI
jgi:hypothetical protein